MPVVWASRPGCSERMACVLGGRAQGREGVGVGGRRGVSVHLGGIERLAAVVRQDVLVRVRVRLRLG